LALTFFASESFDLSFDFDSSQTPLIGVFGTNTAS